MVELTLKTIAEIILVVLGFVILLFVFYQLFWTGKIDRDVCHQSVIFRATLPSVAEELVPLKCKTEKICITSGIIGGKCKEFAGLKGVTKIKVKSTLEIEKAIAQNIVDCWSMMGEGKVSIFSQFLAKDFGIGSVYPTCVICSRIAFDIDSLKKAGIDENELAKVNVFRYMMTRKVPNKEVSYYEWLTRESPVSVSVKENFNISEIGEVVKNGVMMPVTKDEKTSVTTTTPDMSGQGSEMQKKEFAVMFMQITAPEYGKVLKNDLYTIAGAFLLSPKATTKAITNGYALAVLAILGVYQLGSIAWNQAVTAGYCGDVEVGSEARGGCSVVRTVNYDASDIAQYCEVVESIP